MLKPGSDTRIDFEFVDQVSKGSIPRDDTPDFLNNYFANVGARKTPDMNLFVDEYL